MKTDTMRRIDRLAGSPLCHLAALLKSLFTRPAKGETVVVCKFFGMGSICLSHPLLRELDRQGRLVVYLTFRANEPVIDHLGVNERIIIDPGSAWTFIRSTLGAIVRLRRLRPVIFLNLEFFSRFAALMTLASGAPERAGFHIVHLPVGKLYTHRANLNVYRHISENFLNIAAGTSLSLEELALDDQAAPSGFDDFPQPLGRDAETSLSEGVLGDDYIVINGESSETIRALKSWPETQWARLVKELRRIYPAHSIAVIGTNTGADVYDAVRAQLGDDPKIVNLVGRTTYAELTQVLAGAQLVITVDSGPLHLSALMKRPTVCLFGPEQPALYGHKFAWVRTLYKGLICSPCLALYDAKQSVLDCRDNQCMKQISVDEVVKAATELLTPSERAAKAS